MHERNNSQHEETSWSENNSLASAIYFYPAGKTNQSNNPTAVSSQEHVCMYVDMRKRKRCEEKNKKCTSTRERKQDFIRQGSSEKKKQVQLQIHQRQRVTQPRNRCQNTSRIEERSSIYPIRKIWCMAAKKNLSTVKRQKNEKKNGTALLKKLLE